MERCEITGSYTFAPSGTFFGMYMLSGRGCILADGKEKPFSAGDQFFVPAAAEAFTVRADEPVTIFISRGPKI